MEKIWVVYVHESSEEELRDFASIEEEALGLVEAVPFEVVGTYSMELKKIHPATYISKGHVESVKALIQSNKSPLTFVNTTLSPVQQRNLEKAWNCKVIDRTGLILEIFAGRAQSFEGKLQVTLASLNYQRSRLVKSWTHLERQRGGLGFIGGPGESQLELDRRIIDDKILKIKKDLDKAVKTRSLHRKSRSQYPTIALVGYTNSGKSTLFNRLTNAHVLAKDLLFATLDPTMRKMTLPSHKEVIISDTVGFISGLPTQLIAAFRATLEEVCVADLIVHVRDSVHKDTEAQRVDVLNVLQELGAQDVPVLEVFNKIDLMEEEEKNFYRNKSLRDPNSVCMSALTGEGCEDLSNKIDILLGGELFTITIPVTEGDLIAFCHQHGHIIYREDFEDHLTLTLRMHGRDKKILDEKCRDRALEVPVE